MPWSASACEADAGERSRRPDASRLDLDVHVRHRSGLRRPIVRGGSERPIVGFMSLLVGLRCSCAVASARRPIRAADGHVRPRCERAGAGQQRVQGRPPIRELHRVGGR
jgi:hypothetical protein